jgi:hypothetical protein
MSPLTVYRADGTPKTSAPSSLSIPLDPWHNIGAAGEPGFQNGWAAYPGHTPPAFRRMPDGTVQLRGFLRSGTMSTAMFTLPIGYRPKTYVNVMSSASYSAPNYVTGYIQIYPDGTVIANSGTNSQQSIDSIFFDTELITAMPTGPPGPQGATGPQGGNSVILLDQWHTVGAVGEPPLLNGWLAIGAGYEAQFRKDPMGRVFLRGALGAGLTGQSAFQLPAGYRPLKPVEFPQSVNATFGRSYVDTSGNVLLFGNTNHWLTTIQFDTDTVTQMPSGPKGDTGATGGNATVPMDPWHVVGGVGGEPPFTNNWSSYLGGAPQYPPVAFRKNPLGVVQLRGVLLAGTAQTANAGTTAFTLPVGYRPVYRMLFDTTETVGQKSLVISPDGTVTSGIALGAGNGLLLDGLSFDTDTVTAMPTGPQGPQGPPGNSITVPMDTWHIIGAVGEAPFASGWGARSGGFTVQYRKDPLGKVSLRGCLQNTSAFSFSGTNTTLFTLPAGYRPAGDSEFICPILEPSGANSTGNHILVNVIAATGIVSISQFGPMPGVSGGAGTYLWVDELDFDTGLVTAMPTGPQGPPGPSTPVQRVTSLPGNMYDGLEVYLVAAAGPPAVIWHMRFNGTTNKWEYIGGPPISYQMEGANIGYVGATNNTNITVDAAQSTLLQWLFTPPLDCWIELTMNVGLMAKTDAAYHYAYLNLIASPAPAIGTVSSGPYQTQHSQVQQYMGYQFTKRFGLTAGVAYQFYGQWAMSGGTWSYYQGPGTLWLTGKAWPR